MAAKLADTVRALFTRRLSSRADDKREVLVDPAPNYPPISASLINLTARSPPLPLI